MLVERIVHICNTVDTNFSPYLINSPLFCSVNELSFSLFWQHFKPGLEWSQGHSYTHVEVLIGELGMTFSFDYVTVEKTASLLSVEPMLYFHCPLFFFSQHRLFLICPSVSPDSHLYFSLSFFLHLSLLTLSCQHCRVPVFSAWDAQIWLAEWYHVA